MRGTWKGMISLATDEEVEELHKKVKKLKCE